MSAGRFGPHRTLFAPRYRELTPAGRPNYPYPMIIDSLYNGDDPEFGGAETCAFSDVMEYERGFYMGSRTTLIGGIRMRIGKGSWINLESRRRPVDTPDWVESDCLCFKIGNARGVLLVEHGTVFQKLVAASAHKKLGMVLVTGHGIPRAPARRVLHRIHHELRLPVYLLADSDTWGYFLFSVMKRGLMAPHARCPYLAVAKLRFLGLRSGDLREEPIREKMLNPWKQHWLLRLRELRKYPCFRSRKWQQELTRFQQQRAGLESRAVIERLGADALIAILREKLRRSEWLQ